MKAHSKRRFTADFKLKVVLEVLKEKDTLVAISKRHELHGTGHPAQPDFGLEEALSRAGRSGLREDYTPNDRRDRPCSTL